MIQNIYVLTYEKWKEKRENEKNLINRKKI